MAQTCETCGAVVRRRWTVRGRVQGVGFRPFVYRLAQSLGLTGFVRNDATEVIIEIQGSVDVLGLFEKGFCDQLPRLAGIDQRREEACDPVIGERSFTISASTPGIDAPRGVTPDAAICPDCVREMLDRDDRRFGHGLISCSHCGPRYSILRSAPYDRCNTTMSHFAMCSACAAEYEDPQHRRFHAQPISCGVCGPKLSMVTRAGEPIDGDPIRMAVERLNAGEIVAIKGIGGFHLAVRADDDQAVFRLRRLKRRDARPFAVMTATVDAAERLIRLSSAAIGLMRGAGSPIILAPRRAAASAAEPGGGATPGRVATGVAPNNHRLGVMVANTPVQHLLFACEHPKLEATFLVMTSGNLCEEPLVTDNEEAVSRLGGLCDAILWHNRPIWRPVDDSVFLDMGDEAPPLPVRRARGFAPSPVALPLSVDQPGVCLGGELKNTVALMRGDEVYLSAHVGDLKNVLAYEHFRRCVRDLQDLFDIQPAWIAHDLHPGYLSTHYARHLAETLRLPLVSVQHHHAHAAAVLAENGVTEKVIAIVCDGVGYGENGETWGGEVLYADLADYRRVGHLEPIALAGADAAAKDTSRCALGLLQLAMGDSFDSHPIIDSFELPKLEREMLRGLLAHGSNCVMSSAAGRMFDGVAALLGVCRRNRFEAEAPIALEAAAYGFESSDTKPMFEIRTGRIERIDYSPLVLHLARQGLAGQPVGELAALFHDQFAEGLATMALRAMRANNVQTVALSGGVFCNQRLTRRLSRRLEDDGARVLTHSVVPANDGGLALGQAAVAAARLRSGLPS